MKDLYIYFYDQSGVLTGMKPIKNLEEKLPYMLENELGEMVFPSGVTDVAPQDDMTLCFGVGPFYDEVSKEWTCNETEVKLHLDSIKEGCPKSETEQIKDDQAMLFAMILQDRGWA